MAQGEPTIIAKQTVEHEDEVPNPVAAQEQKAQEQAVLPAGGSGAGTTRGPQFETSRVDEYFPIDGLTDDEATANVGAVVPSPDHLGEYTCKKTIIPSSFASPSPPTAPPLPQARTFDGDEYDPNDVFRGMVPSEGWRLAPKRRWPRPVRRPSAAAAESGPVDVSGRMNLPILAPDRNKGEDKPDRPTLAPGLDTEATSSLAEPLAEQLAGPKKLRNKKKRRAAQQAELTNQLSALKGMLAARSRPATCLREHELLVEQAPEGAECARCERDLGSAAAALCRSCRLALCPACAASFRDRPQHLSTPSHEELGGTAKRT